jgi:hypothetical protein
MLEAEILRFDSSIASITEVQTGILASIDVLANGKSLNLISASTHEGVLRRATHRI